LEAWTAVLAALRTIKEQNSLSSWIQADLMIVNQLHGTVERWYSRHLRSLKLSLGFQLVVDNKPVVGTLTIITTT
jgi:hypothetical protein